MIFGKFRGPDTTERMFLGRREKEMRDVIKNGGNFGASYQVIWSVCETRKQPIEKKDTRKTFSKPETSGFHAHSTKKVKGQNGDNSG